MYQGAGGLPVRVSRYAPRARDVALDRETLIREYNTRVLPEAIDADTRLIAALRKLGDNPAAEAWVAEADRSPYADRKRYCLDIARELYYLRARDALAARAGRLPYPGGQPSRTLSRKLDPAPPGDGFSLGDTLRYWKLERLIDNLESVYAGGRYDEAVRLLEGIE